MAGKPRLPLVLTPAERRTLQGWASRRKTAQGLAQRARIVLLCADGKPNTAVAAELGISRDTVGRWRNRFAGQRFAGLSDAPRPGVPRTITDAQIEAVVVKTLEEVHQVTRYGHNGLAAVAGFTCLWPAVLATRPVHVVLVRAPDAPDGFDLALVTTDLAATPTAIIDRYADRWSAEAIWAPLRP